MSLIHPSAMIGEQVQLGEGVEIGPYCILEGAVEVGAGTKFLSNVVVSGTCRIGTKCEIHPFAVIGGAPQDIKYQGEKSSVVIGEQTIIREHVTISRGTAQGNKETRIGKNCMLMAASHVAHDCQLGDNVMFINNVLLGGHCKIGDYVVIGGQTACQQHTHIGEHVYIGGGSGVNGDVPPFLAAFGMPAELAGVNIVGLKQRGMKRKAVDELRHLFREIFHRQDSFSASLARAGEAAASAEGKRLVAFLTQRRAAGHAPLKPRHAE